MPACFSDPMKKPGLCYHSPFKMIYTDSPYAMLVPSFEIFGGENPSPEKHIANAINQTPIECK
jgi:hypothetical protein